MEGKRSRINGVRKASGSKSSRVIRRSSKIRGSLSWGKDLYSSPGKKEVSKFFIFINGILTNPEDVSSWTDLGEDYIEHRTPHKATRLEYRAGAATRRIKQEARVDNLETIAKRHVDENLVLVAHSNGGDICERFVKRGNFDIEELHLIASASEADFEKNGFNKALLDGVVGKIYVYWSPEDRWLKRAKFSKSILSWIGLGYGYLGLVGPQNVDPRVKDRVIEIKRNYDHSDWFFPGIFEQTMRMVSGESLV